MQPVIKISPEPQVNQEYMITRNKSAQKSQANDQNASMLNQLLTRPNITIKKTLLFKKYNEQMASINKIGTINIETMDTDKVVQSIKVKKKKVRAKSPLLDDAEYFPEKCKRNLALKKIALEPKHDYKVVGVTNKRKRTIPLKDCSKLKPNPPKIFEYDPNLTMEELVRIADEEMDDEDFMEILTCPSPVWWEEKGDIEEIRIRFNEDLIQEDTNITETPKTFDQDVPNKDLGSRIIQTTDIKSKSLKTDLNFFKRFVEKRSKLEKVLGTIKFKKRKANKVNHLNNTKKSNNTKRLSSKVRTESVGGLSDVSLNEDLLNTLENIDIPVQTEPESNKSKQESNEFKNESNKDEYSFKMIEIRNLNSIEADDSSNVPKSPKRRQPKKPLRKSKRKKAQKKTLVDDEENPDTVEFDLIKLPSEKPYESPKSIESITLDNSPIAVELDSISDTNIKFLDEYDGRTEKTIDTEKKDGELVTVYKIITTSDVDIEDQIKSTRVSKLLTDQPNEITSFYKNCKRSSITNSSELEKKREEIQKNKEKGRAKMVPNTNVKYCHDCTSIFETDSCQYCVKKKS